MVLVKEWRSKTELGNGKVKLTDQFPQALAMLWKRFNFQNYKLSFYLSA